MVNATSADSLADLPEDIRNEEGIAMAYEATNHLLADPELRYRVERAANSRSTWPPTWPSPNERAWLRA